MAKNPFEIHTAPRYFHTESSHARGYNQTMSNALRVVAKEPAQARQYRRRNLRIAIRQLERAELYIAALHSLQLDEAADGQTQRVLDELTALRQYLLGQKAAG
jgi:hypothetical protein